MDIRVVAPAFGLLFLMVAVWFVLLLWFFRYLRTRHGATYEALGSPSLFWNNSLRNNWLFMKFLCSSRGRELGDPVVANAVRFMRMFLVVYVVLLLGLATLFFTSGVR